LNATNAGYAPDQSGIYAVEITLNNCRDTSGCYEVNIIDVINNTLGAGLIFSPNPTSGSVTITLPEAYDKTEVEVTDQKGKIILKGSYSRKKIIGLSIDQPAGLYFLIIRNNRGDKATLKRPYLLIKLIISLFKVPVSSSIGECADSSKY
jgi:hypothetical protein